MKSAIAIALLAVTSIQASSNPIKERQSTNWTIGQTVSTSSGLVNGHAAKTESQVSEYLGIPFAQAPIGDLRFAAPVKYAGNASLNGSAYGFSCPVQASSGFSGVSPADLLASNITATSIALLGVLSTLSAYSEDCLNLNVWTKPQVGEAKKAVLVWVYGGAFKGGSSASAASVGSHIVEQEDVVVVSFNYRLDILGFPGSPTTPNNLAFLDQRLAVEWVRDNIANFGGDPTRITLFGQSAGASSIDFYTYAWKDDPIVAGFIEESGTAFSWGLPSTKAGSAAVWYTVTKALGCGDASLDAATVLSCMRKQSYTSILAAVTTAGEGAGGALGLFNPTVDDTVVFSNYSQRTPSNLPILMGTNNYEAGYFRTTFALAGIHLSDTYWDDFNLQEFTCPCGIRANASLAANNPTWRYRYFGVFPDVAISSEAGTYHVAEVPQIFDTRPTTAGVPNATVEEISISKYMRTAWATFAKDPVNGLTNYGWPTYNTSQDTLVRLGYENITGPNLINPYRYDADCVFVDVHSTNSSDTPKLPDLGASVTPTGTGTGSAVLPSRTASGNVSSTGSAGGSTTSSISSGGRVGVALGMVLLPAFAMWFI